MLLRMTINTRRNPLGHYAGQINAPNICDRLTKIVRFISFSVVCFIDFSLLAASGKLTALSDILTENGLKCRKKCLADANSRFWRQVSIDKPGIFL